MLEIGSSYKVEVFKTIRRKKLKQRTYSKTIIYMQGSYSAISFGRLSYNLLNRIYIKPPHKHNYIIQLATLKLELLGRPKRTLGASLGLNLQ